jgi:predicted  nucleic acid-binding Zn-ribbon protein
MTTKKRPTTTPDLAALKQLIQEQAQKIVALEKEAVDLKTSKTNAEDQKQTWYKKFEELQTKLEGLHDLFDAQPGTLPHITKGKNSWGGECEKEQDIIVRAASWLGAVTRS